MLSPPQRHFPNTPDRITEMKFFLQTLLLCAVILVGATLTSAQKSGSRNSDKSSVSLSALKTTAKVAGKPFINAAGKAAVIVIKSAAKATWVTTKFAAMDMLKPMAEKVVLPLLINGTPLVAKYMLKGVGIALKKGLPMALKLSLL